jgi:hypothetical protein
MFAEITSYTAKELAMNDKARKRIALPLVALVALTVVGGCAGPTPGPTPTSTPIPLTATPTPIPATPTPACEVRCDIDPERQIIEISCESGQVTIKADDTMSYVFDGGVRVGNRWQLNQERTYKNTGNTYKIVGDIEVRFKFDDRGAIVGGSAYYHLTVTGGVFGQTPQTCEKVPLNP